VKRLIYNAAATPFAKHIVSKFITFQQHNAPAEMSTRLLTDFISPLQWIPNSADLKLFHYEIRFCCCAFIARALSTLTT